MQITDYHSKYFAYELTRDGEPGLERLSRSLFDAAVDLNPHQIEAALFAVRSPLSKGVLLADEVGLGKTIEAGIVLCQLWAERKRKILVICPASLRKQWALELEEKFNLPCIILDAKTYKSIQSQQVALPFEQKKVVITSLHFASRHAEDVRATGYDLVVIDEAHKLRNCYRASNRIGQNILWATSGYKKILLTATPLQNSLLELYGLSQLIDERIFADLPSFRTQYTTNDADLISLRKRIQSFCHRTLRQQVTEYVPYTARKLITRPFEPTDQEQKLYNSVSAFLQRNDTFAMPYKQKHLTALIVRKLLASSPHALAGTLEVMRNRLIALRDEQPTKDELLEDLIEQEELEDELLEDILSDPQDLADFEGDEEETSPGVDLAKLNAEIEELDRFIQWAYGIGVDTKTKSLLKALETGFAEMEKIGAARKAVIFTESRRTQQYVQAFLESNGYTGKTITFNGTNNDPASKEVYERWVQENKHTGRSTGSRPVDIRTAIMDHFKDDAEIFIATEAAAEGVNLQFCSLVINFDLPWNPQRIEQRIGRCHRYGQKHDVVVINFLNKKNAADCRVYELLQHKFNLFEGVFGASDDVLGTVESGIDFERRILDIYQECRTQDEIQRAFDELQKEYEASISVRMDDTRHTLMEHFDEDVHERLKMNLANTRTYLDRFHRMFWGVTQHELDGDAEFDNEQYMFQLNRSPIEDAQPGLYHLISKEQKNVPGHYLYRLSHPLGQQIVEASKERDLGLAKVQFDISNHPTKLSVVKELKGHTGWLRMEFLAVETYEREEHLLFSGFDSTGAELTQDILEKLFQCSGKVAEGSTIPPGAERTLSKCCERHMKAILAQSLERNSAYFNEARERLERWADDMVIAAEKDLRTTKERIKALNREARKAETIEDQNKIQQEIKKLEQTKRRQRQQIFDVEDEIEEKRDTLIGELEKKLTQTTETKPLFTIAWEVA
jgi:hypothetical protein